MDDTADIEAVRRYWNDHVHDWKIARNIPGTQEFFEEIEAYRFEKLSYLPELVNFGGYAGQRVLDVGCGVANDLSRFAKGGAQVVGVDLTEHSIELAKRNFQQRALPGEFHIMNGEHLELPANSFDLVYCHTVLHFTPHPERLIQEIHRVLKPGKQAIIMTVNRHSWLNLMHHVMKVEIDYLGAPVFHRYTAREFRDLLKPFSTVRIVTERFPVRTKVHKGLKAKLYNLAFVALFNSLPRSWVGWSGYHLMAFASKAT